MNPLGPGELVNAALDRSPVDPGCEGRSTGSFLIIRILFRTYHAQRAGGVPLLSASWNALRVLTQHAAAVMFFSAPARIGA
jgi:hypothetical protein